MNDNLKVSPASVSPTRRRERIAHHAVHLGTGSAGRVQAAQILRDIEALHPGEIERQAARIQARRLGLPPLAMDWSVLDWPEAGHDPA